jgi:hypothetical protein
MGYRWRGFEHPELYNMINSGPGASASEPQTTYWKSLTDELTQVDDDLNKKLTDMGAAWEGQAAERAQSGLTPLGEWASDAETGSTVMQISAENQADYVSDARASMPEPVPVTTPAPSGWQMAAAAVGGIVPTVMVAAQAADHEAQEAAQSEAEQRAVQTMETYESSSTWNRDTLGTFVSPPDVVVSTPAPQNGTVGHVEPAQSQVGTHAGVGSQATTPSGFTVPSGNGTAGTGGTLVPTGGGTTTPPSTLPVGGGVSAPPAVTTPSGLVPTTGQPPFGGPSVQPGPGSGTPVLPGTGPGAQNINNPLLPSFSNNGTGLPTNGGNGPLNRGPLVVGPSNNSAARGPLNVGPGGAGNASDVARRTMPPLRGGVPGVGGTGGGGLGGVSGFGADSSRSASQFGRPGAGGAVPGANAAARGGPGAASAAGGRGAVAGGRPGGVAGPMGAGGRRGDGEDDDERYAPDYLLETEDVFGDDRRVVPGVIGETAPLE